MSENMLNGHRIDYVDHRFECRDCRARLISLMQFQTRECPGPVTAPSPVPPDAPDAAVEGLARLLFELDGWHPTQWDDESSAEFRMRARKILASDWLADQFAEAESGGMDSVDLAVFGTWRRLAEHLRTLGTEETFDAAVAEAEQRGAAKVAERQELIDLCRESWINLDYPEWDEEIRGIWVRASDVLDILGEDESQAGEGPSDQHPAAVRATEEG